MSIGQSEFEISHCTGIDKGSVLAVKAGHSGSNDLIWVGRAANLAAKLSDIREEGYLTFITDDAYRKFQQTPKRELLSQQATWTRWKYEFLGEQITIYGTDHQRVPT